MGLKQILRKWIRHNNGKLWDYTLSLDGDSWITSDYRSGCVSIAKVYDDYVTIWVTTITSDYAAVEVRAADPEFFDKLAKYFKDQNTRRKAYEVSIENYGYY